MKKINCRNQEAGFAKRDKLGCSSTREGHRAPRYSEPKTSEYKNYLQLLEKVGHKNHGSSAKQDEHLPESRNQLQREKNTAYEKPIFIDTKVSRCKNAEICFSKPVRSGSSYDLGSPRSHESSRRGCMKAGQTSVTPNFLSNPANSTKNGTKSFFAQAECPDEEYKSDNIFISKRYRLLHLASKTLSVDIDDLFANRSAFISDFLQRQGVDAVNHELYSLDSNSKETSFCTGFVPHNSPLLDYDLDKRFQVSDSDCWELSIPLSGKITSHERDSLSFLSKKANSLEQYPKRRRREYSMGINDINYFEESYDGSIESTLELSRDGYGYYSSHSLPLELGGRGTKNLCYWPNQEESCTLDDRSSSQYMQESYNGYLSEHNTREALALPLLCWDDARDEDNLDLALIPSNVKRDLQSNSVSNGTDYLWNDNSQCNVMNFCYQTLPPFYPSSNQDALQPTSKEYAPLMAAEGMLQREGMGSSRTQMLDYSPQMTRIYKVNKSFCAKTPTMGLIEGVFSHDFQCQKELVSSGLDFEVKEGTSLAAASITSNSIVPTRFLDFYNENVNETKRDDSNHSQYTGSELTLCHKYSEASQICEIMSKLFDVGKLSSYLSASPYREPIYNEIYDSSRLNLFQDGFPNG